MEAQNMEALKWKNRVLLVLTDDVDSVVYKNQVQELEAHANELKDRKLLVYHIKKDAYKQGLNQNKDWEKATEIYKKYKKDKGAFEVVLIGLDGGVKLRETNMITCETLFSIIDVMPMRQSELDDE